MIVMHSNMSFSLGRFGLLAVGLALGAYAQVSPSPVSAEINRVLPSRFTFGGLYRFRLEDYSGGGFAAKGDTYALSELRLNLTFRAASWAKFFAEGMDSRPLGRSSLLPAYSNTWDIRQAYGELGDVEKGRWGLRVGRQELNYGEQRLIGSTPWNNLTRVFDAVRATVHYGGYRLDAFSSSVVLPVNGTWDHHLQGNNLHGLYGGMDKLVPNAVIEPYFLWRLQPRVKNETGAIANLDEKIGGVRMVGKLPGGFDYGTEMVKESGSLGSNAMHAWAGHWVVGRLSKSLPTTPRVYAEYNYATGDKNPKDGTIGTFDVLYPSGHDKLGLSDQVGWRNVRDIRAGVETRPVPKVEASLEYNDWHLDSATDAIYSSSGATVVRNATGSFGTHIGQEADVIVHWTPVKYFRLSGGYGHIFPGEFLQKATPRHGYNFPYLFGLWMF